MLHMLQWIRNSQAAPQVLKCCTLITGGGLRHLGHGVIHRGVDYSTEHIQCQ